MKLYRSKGHIWTGTQADAKEAHGSMNFETIEVPTDKPNLIRWLNEQEEAKAASTQALTMPFAQPAPVSEEAPQISDTPAEPDPPIREAAMARFEALAHKLGWTPPGGAAPASKAIVNTDIVEAIMDADGATFGNYLSASLERLGELRSAGFNELRRLVSANPRSRTALERGLGYFILEAPEMVVKDDPTD